MIKAIRCHMHEHDPVVSEGEGGSLGVVRWMQAARQLSSELTGPHVAAHCGSLAELRHLK